jgi:hypothetical protein
MTRETLPTSRTLLGYLGLREALERELNAPWTNIRTTAARGLFEKAKASRTGEVTIAAQELAVLLPAIESSAVFLALRAALAAAEAAPEIDVGRLARAMLTVAEFPSSPEFYQKRAALIAAAYRDAR